MLDNRLDSKQGIYVLNIEWKFLQGIYQILSVYLSLNYST